MRLATVHQFVIGGAAVGAGLVCLYAASLARGHSGSSWSLLAGVSAACSLTLGLYLLRFRRTHR